MDNKATLKPGLIHISSNNTASSESGEGENNLLGYWAWFVTFFSDYIAT